MESQNQTIRVRSASRILAYIISALGCNSNSDTCMKYSLLFAVSRRRCVGRQRTVTFLFLIHHCTLYGATCSNVIDGIVPIGTGSTHWRGVVVIIQPVGPFGTR